MLPDFQFLFSHETFLLFKLYFYQSAEALDTDKVLLDFFNKGFKANIYSVCYLFSLSRLDIREQNDKHITKQMTQTKQYYSITDLKYCKLAIPEYDLAKQNLIYQNNTWTVDDYRTIKEKEIEKGINIAQNKNWRRKLDSKSDTPRAFARRFDKMKFDPIFIRAQIRRNRIKSRH